jgi:para-aminobenzoate synthetase component 1
LHQIKLYAAQRRADKLWKKFAVFTIFVDSLNSFRYRTLVTISTESIRQFDHISDAGLLTALAGSGADFAWFGGRGSAWTIVPMNLTAAGWNEIGSTTWPRGRCNHDWPFTGGFAGIIPYEMFSPFRDGPDPLLFRAGGALLRDNRSKTWTVTADTESLAAVTHQAHTLLTEAARVSVPAPTGMTLTPACADEIYENLAEQALEDIKSGRYYQINLLRYFAAAAPDASAIPALLVTRGGPYSCWVRQGDHEVISFSPEHFVGIKSSNDGSWTAATSPIKGTAARSQDPQRDAEAKENLLASKKDRAELHMIIDLMRNDLSRVCKPSSVHVRESGALESFVNVHHLVGRVEGLLADGLTLDTFLKAVCPAGSITGAPKIEVMHAIRSYEGRRRGYFMGNAFILDSGGHFDSSVLIRTISGMHGKNYEFSAGSGIVMSSKPRTERLEIGAKCNVLTPEEQLRWP